MLKKLLTLLGALALTAGIYAAVADAQTHTVQRGETLYSISKQYGTSVEKIKNLNNMKLSIVYPNQTLQVLEEPPAPKPEPPKEESNVAKEMRVTATAYTAYCAGCSGITATGINLRANPYLKVIAVDPRVIKLGSKVWVEGYGEAIAGDTGGAIKGNKIDVFIPNKARAYQWGRKTVTIKVLK
ncbi:hypothetical protein GCM10007425_25990 [Lysinibacillus alkalisoli]|uniref:LysM domain-containing protein n=1 Tax=Lysinibacillus alkalisoli TaxID=1911548 RepID=A0A917G961_9BACI|nr:3D domain-containing protein [Lysinibacillus alkalisoli]GGG30151.1 hypothetical protein GCM10007425_25990 [Lysinibacillus alkalisoli]